MKISKIIFQLIFSLFCFALSANEYDKKLILHYTFEDDGNTSVIADASPAKNDGKLRGRGAYISNGILTLPGGTAGSTSAYVELPTGMFDGQDTLTISVWLMNKTGSANYAAMYFGTTETYPLQYWLLNPQNPSGRYKSVITNATNTSSPWNSEYGISPSNSAQGIQGPLTNSNWHLYTSVITPNSITSYYDNTKIGSVSISRKVSQFGTNLAGYIGKSSYPDMLFNGSVANVKVYKTALTDKEVENEYFSLLLTSDLKSISIEGNVIGDLNLPTTGNNSSSIVWASSDIGAISEKGIVTRHASKDKKVMLTATATLGNYQKTKHFPVRVYANTDAKNIQYFADNLDLGITYITGNISMPTSSDPNISLKWSSSETALISADGIVSRPASGSGNKTVQLTATITTGKESLTKAFNVTVAEADYGSLLAYNLNGTTERKRSFFAANSTTGNVYTELNNGKALIYPLIGTKKMRNPQIFRQPNGRFGVIASNNNSSPAVMVYLSPDLINYEQETLLALNNSSINVLNPLCRYDNLQKAYVIEWLGSNGRKYKSITKDFKTILSTEEISFYNTPTVTGTFPTDASDISAIGLTKSEYEKVIQKYAPITNTEIETLAPIAFNQGNPLTLPDRVTAKYSDGSTKQFGVVWDTEQLNSLKTNTPGTYTISGTVQQPDYSSPLIQQRADPWIVKGNDGYYYFTASYPMVGSSDPEGYDRVILRRSTTIEGLKNAPEISIWDESECSSCYCYVWAPEIHEINGTWFVFFTTSVSSSNVWAIRPRIIACTLGDKNPYDPACWEDVGHLMAPSAGDNVSFTNFSLDMTHFENKGTHYVAWAQTIGNSSLAIASVNGTEPWETTSQYTLLTAPEYAWEWDKEWVNEGPAVLKHNGKIYLAFSASSVNSTYCVGLLYADENSDLLDPKSWTKVRYPLLSTEDLPSSQNGPGHNSFSIDQYGNPIMIYHARNPQETTDGGLYDPGRHTFIKGLNFAKDGMPVFNMTRDQELAPENKVVSISVIVK